MTKLILDAFDTLSSAATEAADGIRGPHSALQACASIDTQDGELNSEFTQWAYAWATELGYTGALMRHISNVLTNARNACVNLDIQAGAQLDSLGH